jgi:hypothetical protein
MLSGGGFGSVLLMPRGLGLRVSASNRRSQITQSPADVWNRPGIRGGQRPSRARARVLRASSEHTDNRQQQHATTWEKDHFDPPCSRQGSAAHAR